MQRSNAKPGHAQRTSLTKRIVRIFASFAIAASCVLAAPAWAGGTTVEDAISGDGTAIGGTNISDLKEQIKRDRLSCAGGEAGAGVLVALGALGVIGARARRRGRGLAG